MNPRTLGRIAVAVFRESVRDRVLYNLGGFALLVIGASYLIGQLTAGQDVKIIKDLGLAAMAVFGLFIAIFIGIGLVSKEVERKSIYSLIAKPVRRSELVVGTKRYRPATRTSASSQAQDKSFNRTPVVCDNDSTGARVSSPTPCHPAGRATVPRPAVAAGPPCPAARPLGRSGN